MLEKQTDLDTQTLLQERKAISVINPFSFARILADYAPFFYAIFFALSQTKDYSTPSFLSDMIKIHLFVLEKQNCCYLYSSSCVHRGNETSVKLQFAEIEECDT